MEGAAAFRRGRQNHAAMTAGYPIAPLSAVANSGGLRK